MKKHGLECLFPSRRLRTLALGLIPLVIWTSCPPESWTATHSATPLSTARSVASLKAPTAPIAAEYGNSNRALPKVGAPPLWPVFSARPSEVEISKTRVFEEPLVPMGGQPTAKENKALSQALLVYIQKANSEDVTTITQFLKRHPQSVWRASLLINLGLVYRKAGYASQALAAWEEAWQLARNESDLKARALADRAVGELAELTAKLGHDQRVESLLAELEGREIRGSATEKLTIARESLWLMRNYPEASLRCGPVALGRMQYALQPAGARDARILHAQATRRGTSLAQLHALATEVGMKYQMAWRELGARFLLPAVVHWKLGHYGALVKEQNGRYLIQDPTLDSSLGGEIWVRPAVLELEASGYYLVPAGPLPEGWQAVTELEGGSVWGRGPTTENNRDATGENQHKVPRSTKDCPMAQYAVHTMLVSLNIVDTPVGYTPPRGPDIKFRVTYNQREANQPAVFNYSSLGPKWTFDWLSYIVDDPSNPSANVSLFARGGGTERYTGFSMATQSFAPQVESRAVIVRISTSPIRYERRLPDGSKEIFSQPNGTTARRKVFLTQVTDAAGNTLNVTYDANLRLVAITDALNQVTTLSYDRKDDIYLITKVTDPFGRFAEFQYDTNRRLERIIDVIGINSAFTYAGTGDVINSMTTPYGTTQFAFSEGPGNTRWLQATDSQGDIERVEFLHAAPGIAESDPVVPTGIIFDNRYMHFRNTFYWDKKAWREHPNDYTKARIFHWLHQDDALTTSNILESEKNPLENRVWYNYPGTQPVPIWFSGSTHALPSKIARVLDSGDTQLYQYEYNSLGKVTRATDPAGRVLSYLYAPNQIDLLEVRQTRGTNNELIARFTYNTQHRPLTATDASGQTYRFTYNGEGQLLTVADPKNETTALTYDSNGYLIRITGPGPGITLAFTYDGAGRVQTQMDSEDYTIVLEYDALDRPTQVAYPDGTFQQILYDRLDPIQYVDRLGRMTQRSYNGLRQLEAIQDALGRTTRFEWCRCGGLEKIIDPLNRETTWTFDVQGRVVGKVHAAGSQIRYAYEASTGRLAQVTDAQGQRSEYDYLVDDNLRQVYYVDTGRVVTPPVRFTYDPDYNRVVTVQDGTGRTTYRYNPITSAPVLGAGRLASITGPLPNSTITYSYDELGRVVNRAVQGVEATVSYDALGRVTQATNPLGTYEYRYVRTSDRLDSINYPNGQRTLYGYYDILGDQRLQEIRHLNPAAAMISTFNYAYNAVGQVTSWIRQADTLPSTVYSLDYDAADQLLRASSKTPGNNQFTYEYDAAANRTSEQINDGITLSTYNNLNQLISRELIMAPDSDPVVRRNELEYDGMGRRVRIVEKEDEVVISEKRFVWCGRELCEERDATGASVTKRFYAQGMQLGTDNYFYTRDHLGNLREMSDSTGAIRARYDYDPYGRRTKLTGDLDADFGFTGHYFHPRTGLHLALYRAYDANLGRWITRDPIAEAGGLNLYAYVENDPINSVDLDGRGIWAALPAFVAGSPLLTLVALVLVGVVIGKAISSIGDAHYRKKTIKEDLERLDQLYKLKDQFCKPCEASTYPETCKKIDDEIQWRQARALGNTSRVAEDVYKATNKPGLGARW